MRQKSIWMVFLCPLFILLAHPASALPIPPPNPDFAESQSSTTLSFDATNDLIVINATVNGKGPFRFQIDTGASHHVMTPELAQSLGLRVEGNAILDSGGRARNSAGVVQVAEVRVGDFRLERQSFIVAALPPSYPFQGFLGAEFFKHFIVRIDFRQSLLTLTTGSVFRYQGDGISLPIKFHAGLIPQVKAEVDGKAGWFKLDTGYNGSLALFGKFIYEHHLLAEYAPRQGGTGARTLTEEFGDVPAAQIRVFKLGHTSLGKMLASFFLEREGSNSIYAGAIGTGILKQFNVIINYQKQRLILESR